MLLDALNVLVATQKAVAVASVSPLRPLRVASVALMAVAGCVVTWGAAADARVAIPATAITAAVATVAANAIVFFCILINFYLLML